MFAKTLIPPRLFILIILSVLTVWACNKKNDPAKDKGDSPDIENEVPIFKRETGIELLEFDGTQLPAEAKFEGAIVMGERWNDLNGENFLILTETESRLTGTEEEMEEYSADLYGYHYVKKDGKLSLLWDIYDFEKDCPFDLLVSHVPRSLTITDLDKNGYAESTFLYRLACRSDVSPSTMKLMMHEKGNKYALRGDTRVDYGPGEIYGGEYTVDQTFEKAPAVFLDYAKKQWNAFVVEF
jgi:hypothetical protein